MKRLSHVFNRPLGRGARLAASVAPLFAFALLLGGCGSPVMPDVAGLDMGVADAQLEDAGISSAFRVTHDEYAERGSVISTDPVAGQDVPEGTKATLLISSGPPFRMIDLMADDSDLSTSVTAMGEAEVGTGGHIDGTAAYPVDDCWPSEFQSTVGKTVHATFTVDSSGEVMSIAVYDMGSRAAAEQMENRVASAQEACSSGPQARPVFAPGGMLLGASWNSATTLNGHPALVSDNLPNLPGSELTHGMRVTAASDRYLISGHVLNMKAGYGGAANPGAVDAGQAAVLRDIISSEEGLIRANGIAARSADLDLPSRNSASPRSTSGNSTPIPPASTGPNGIKGKSGQEILDASLAAANKASSVTVKGAVTQGGQEVKLDLQVGQEAAQGSITAQGVNVDIKVLAGKTYFKLSGDAFAKIAGQGDSPEVAKAISALLGDKWLVAPDEASAGQLGSLGQFGQKDELLKGVLTPEGNATVKGTGEVNGQPVVLLESSDGTGTLAIATTGEPYPLQIKGSEGADGGQIDFTDWNAPVNVTAPTDVVDIGQLAALGGSSSSG